VNFALDVVDAADRTRMALVTIDAHGDRAEVAFGEVSDRSARLAGTLVARGVGRGDVVLTLVGNRPDWVYALVACFRIGAVALPCTKQLRPGDLRTRIELVEPRAVIADAADAATIAEAGFDGPVLSAGARRRAAGPSPPATRSSPRGCAAPPPYSTTPASTRTSGST
jgi:acyl-coenzyme A synthetase/AMP-(fatty) acid ligase